ncbi:hypothetical protein LZC95_34525 [Pendulispora brunnea]|uniref:Uncharacterized protein n=1 Tax=Pendulispora brunnea TaxID=2905690 RepID=A0ABZ2JYI5_9BACT
MAIMQPGLVVAHTERVAEELKHRFKGHPRQELDAWLRVAHQREAMVTRIYGLPEIRRRVPDAAEGGVPGVAAKVVKGIWAQEEGHTRLLGAVRLADGDRNPALEEIQGKLEGEVTLAGCSGSVFARLAIAIGAFFEQVPAFAKEIDAMTLLEFYGFCAELEDTASHGYKRMIALSDAIVREDSDDNPVFQLPYELTRILLEERYHAAVLRCLAQWVEKDGNTFRGLQPKDCVLELRTLANKHLHTFKARLTHAQACGEPSQISAPPKTEEWISDGGMGDLFAEYGLSAPVVESKG